jgi:DNA-binding response OmpR family regulator
MKKKYPMARKNKILLVEDEESLAVGLEFNLNAEGYVVTWVTDGEQAVKTIMKDIYDLVLLDIMLPYLDGFEVARKIREKDPKLPVLILTARTSLNDRLKGLEIGADDYMTKPFHLEELLLRIKGMLRRKQWYDQSANDMPFYQIGNAKINFENFNCENMNGEFRLTLREAMLLKYLIDHKGKTISRKELLENVWNITTEIETRTVDNFVSRLRKYIEEDPEKPRFIKSIRGVGYLFNDQS